MKQESTKKSNKLFLVIGIAAILVVVGVLLAIFLPGMLGGEQAGGEVSSKIYWNVDRAEHTDPETGLSARLPGEDGLYHILFSVEGEQVELCCSDKKLLNKLDLNTLMGLVFDENGIIIDMMKIEDMVGKVVKNVFVQSVTDTGFTTNSSFALNGMEVKYKLNENTKIYDVSDKAEKVGAPGKMGVMDKVTVLLDAEGNVTHVYVVERAWESLVYWRVSASRYNSSTKKTGREPDADGYYTYTFFVDGQYVTLRTKKEDVATAIDSYSNTNASCGLILDENGLIDDVFSASRAAKGKVVSNNYTVMSVEGNNFMVEALTGSDTGKTYNGTITEKTKVYDMTNTSDKVGTVTELRVNDNVYAIADANGELLYVFVTSRRVDAPVYAVMNRKYSTTKAETTQKPDEDGWYVIEVVAGTKKMTVRTKDVDIANQIHAPISRMVGLRLDGDVVLGVYDPGNVTGGKTFALWQYVTAINGPIMTSQLGGGSSGSTGVVKEDCEIYLIGYNSTVPYKKTTLKVDDRILAMTDANGEVCLIYVWERKVDLPVYWNTAGRKWSSAKQETTRVPDAEGYYVYTMTTGGKRPVQLKTKDKKIADWLDKQALTCYALKVDKNGIIKEAHAPAAACGGQSIASYYTITSINGKHIETVNSAGTVSAFDLTSDYKCYNVSGGLGCWEYMGEKATPKVGDKVQGFTDRAGKSNVPLLYIVNRPENKNFVVGWKVDRKYSTAKQETTRIPDADGYYVYQMAVKGEIKTFKTKDKNVANALDKEITAVAMNVKNGIVYRSVALNVTSVYGTGGIGSYYTVMKIDGNKLFMRNTAGKEAEVVLEKKYECYDVSAHAEKFGAKTKIKVGDKLQSYYNQEETGAILVYVVNSYARQTDMNKPCPHCGEVVMWTAYTGNVGTGHYYLAADRNAGQITIGADADGNPYDFVLDMNGYDFNCTGKAFLVWKNAKAYIFDSTGYDFTVTGKGAANSYHSGVIQMLAGELTLIGGNYVYDDSTGLVVREGVMSVMDKKAVVNATGVDFVGGTLYEHQPAEGKEKKSNFAPTIGLENGTATFKDCTFTGGVNPASAGNGGNVYAAAGNYTFDGCTFTGGEATRGGALSVVGSAVNLTLTNTVINGGEASNGGAVFVYNGTVTLGEGTKISGGTAKDAGDNLWISGANSKVTLDGAEIDGGCIYSNGTYLKVTGDTKISKNQNGLMIYTDKYVNVDGLTGQVYVSGSGILTEALASDAAAKAVIDNGYIVSPVEGAEFYIKDGAIGIGRMRCPFGHAEHTDDSCTGNIVAWAPWADPESLPTAGYYYLTCDVDVTKAYSTSSILCIDLNSYDITRTVSEATNNNYVLAATGEGMLLITDSTATPGTVKTVATYTDGVVTSLNSGLVMQTSSKNSTLVLVNGIIDGSGLKTNATGGATITVNGTFQMFGGVVKGTQAQGRGSTITGFAGTTIEIFDGKLINSVAKNGLYTGGVLTMTGGEVTGGIQGGTSSSSACVFTFGGDAVVEGGINILGCTSLTVSGTPELENLTIPAGKTADFTGLTGGEVSVTATGVFTTDFADAAAAEAAKAFITATGNNDVKLSGTALAVEAEPAPVDPTAIVRCINGHTDHTGIDCAEPIVTWKYWNDANARASIESWGGTYNDGEYKTKMDGTGNWILQEDITLASTRANGSGTLRIDLNGHNITRTATTASPYTRVFNVGNGGTIEITDLSTEGKAGIVSAVVSEGVTVNYNSSSGYGALVYVGANSFKLAGRAVLDGSNLSTTATTGGATVQVNNAGESFIMYGGVVKGMAATGTSASAVHGWGGASIEIYGGEIISVDTEIAVYAPTNFTMTGGKIVGSMNVSTGATAKNRGAFTVGGDAEITGTIQLKGCASATISGTPRIANLINTSEVMLNMSGVTGGNIAVEATGVFTTDFANATAAENATKYISSSEANKSVIASGKALKVVDSTELIHCIKGHTTHAGIVCDEPIVTWKYWNQANAEAASSSYAGIADVYKSKLTGTGNWILIDDITLTAQRTTGNGTLRVDLNGHTITRLVDSTATSSNARAFYVYDMNTGDTITPRLAITDLSTEGEPGSVKLAYAAGVTTKPATGSIVYVGNGPFTLAGRAVLDGSNLSTTSTSGGVSVLVNSNRTFTMYSGTIKGMASSASSSSAVSGYSNSIINIYGGEISAPATEKAVYAGGTFNMTGGKITQGMQIGTGSSSTCVVNLSGNAVIEGGADLKGFNTVTVQDNVQVDNMIVADGEKITVGELGATAKIGITASEVFTTEGDAATLAGYVTSNKVASAVAGKFVVPSGNALTVSDTITRCVNGHLNHTGIDCSESIVTWKIWNDANARASIESWGGTYNDGEYKTRMDGTGNWILLEDITLASVRTTGNGTLRIDLNGHNITRNVTADGAARAFEVKNTKGNLAITDLSTTGEAGTVKVVIADGVSATYSYGAVVYVSTGSFTLAGRAVVDGSNQSTTATTGGATVQINGSKIFKMYGGVIKGMASTGTSSSAVNGWGGSAFTISGGEIISVDTEQAVYAGGNFTMTGGKITNGLVLGTATSTGVINIGGTAVVTGDTALKGCTSATISGAPTIEKLINTSGKTVDTSGVTGGSIG